MFTKEERRNKWAKEHPRQAKKLSALTPAEKKRFALEKAVIKLWQEGKSVLEITRKLKVTYLKVRLILSDIGIGMGIEISDKENKHYEKKAAYIELADMKLTGQTLQQIGEKMGFTRERARQILKKYFPEIVFPKQSGGVKTVKDDVEITCLFCKKIKIHIAYKSNLNKKFCDKACSRAYKNQHAHFKIPIPWKQMTREQFRKYQNQRIKDYYRRHKDDPAFKAKIKEYNRRQAEKRRQKKFDFIENKLTEEDVNKMWADRWSEPVENA